MRAAAASPRSRAAPRYERLAIALLLVAAAAAYAPTLWNGLVWDDLLDIAGSPHAAATTGAALVVGPPGGYYRPAVFLGFVVEHAAWGTAAVGYHLTNLLLHLANTLLLVRVARRSGVAVDAALLGAAVFALHPVQTEAVAYVSGRTDLLMTAGALLSCAALLGSGPVLARGVATAAAGALAMLSKESGFALILLWPWLAWRRASDGRTRVSLVLPGVVTALALIAVRPRALPRSEMASTLPGLAAAGQAALMYSRVLLWPGDLQVDRLTLLPAAPLAQAVGVFALLALLGLAVWGLSRRGAVGDWSAWTCTFYLPVANLLVLYPDIADRALFTPEHNLYAPLAGLGVLAGIATERARAGLRPTARRVATATALVILAGWGIRTAARCTVWHDEERLFGAAVAASATSPRVWYNYGNVLLQRGAVGAAAAAFEGAAERSPNDAAVWANLGVARQQQRNYDAAARAYRRAAALAPRDAQIVENLGTLYLARGDLEAARSAFASALRLDPQRPTARQALSAIERATGRP